MARSRSIQLTGRPLAPDVVEEWWGAPMVVAPARETMEKLAESRRHVEKLLAADRAYYGINTGFGSHCDRRVAAHELEALQENLILSHAVGVGASAPDAIVRLMLLFKAHALSLGHSGVRPVVFESLIGFLNKDVLPVVPCKGSLGASGDLAPLAHLTLALLGHGEVRVDGAPMAARDALKRRGLNPLRLAAKEGLALINGTQFMTAYGAALCVRAKRACRTADVLAALSLEAVRGRLEPFDERLLAMRPHPGAVESGDNIRRLLAGRPKNPSKPYGLQVQDPYSLRCAPQVHGATRDALRHAEEVIYRDINSVTDNPVVTSDGSILSGGNFHGQPLALALDYLGCAIAELASISDRRQYLLVNDHRFGLPSALIPDSGLNSGFMIVEYTSAALVAENKVLCHPAAVDSIPTAGGQEDHVSMGATAAVKAWSIMDNVEMVLAIELLLAAQALDFTPEADIAPAIEGVHKAVRRHIAHAASDRQFGRDVQEAISLVRSAEFLKVAEAAAGVLI